MKCPNCNIDLVMTDHSGIEIDYCPQCRGIWLDRGELDKIIERSAQHMPRRAAGHKESFGSRERGYDSAESDHHFFLHAVSS